MTEQDIRLRVRGLVLAAAPVRPSEQAAAQDTTGLADELGYDSLGFEELMALLEHNFPGLRVPDGIFGIGTVADVEALVVRLLAEAA